MTFTFLDMAGKTLFIRDDAERATWTQEEYSLDLEFPFIDGKVISIGQRIFFKDPATGSHQIYEVKQARTTEPDHFQSVVAEHICISELSDEHMDSSEITNKTAKATLQGVLSGTLWSVGSSAINPTSSGDLSRGSVWQAILQIKDNWNVYIEPRVTLAGNGTITRYLDILSPQGTWNGVRLSIDKNMLDPSVTYDDSEVVTALYGYGGQDPNEVTSEDPQEITFADVVWKKTSDHPAKPKGQKYLEDPAATAAYGRNGRPRFGYFQNNDIIDPELLLQKTWESLKINSKPAISIEGTVADLYRMGYSDQPIKLHDIALVEVLPAGYKDQIQIIRMTVDLLDPSATTLTIGSYIPNIIYIERKTNEDATGGRGGGGGNKSKDNAWHQFETTIDTYQGGTGLVIRSVEHDIKDQTQKIAVVEANLEVTSSKITQEVIDRRDADNVLNGKITVTAKEITAEVERASKAEGNLSSRITINAEGIATKVSKNGVISAINQTAESVKISANRIELDGTTIANLIKSEEITVNGLTVNNGIDCKHVDCTTIDCTGINTNNGNVSCGGNLTVYGNINGQSAEWKSYTARRVTLSGSKYTFPDSGGVGHYMYAVIGYTDTTLHYLGY